ncbi:MAG TPA: hypothetical protein VK611_19610 [Acidimicrobiales bacterium]|nr:hypothetical protein [Acidimicrobiales bacterium]
MAIDLDELLRTQFGDLIDESRGPLEDVEQDVLRRVGRRRRRRRVGAGCGVLAMLALVVAAPTVMGGRSSPDVSTKREAPATTDAPLAPARPVGVERIDAYGGRTGTALVVVHFDAPVPTDAPMYVDDIEHPDAPGIAYTTQRPDRVKVCENTHWFPGDEGTVDVLIPVAWLKPGTRGSDIPLDTHGSSAKVPVCGGPDDVWPLDNHIQIAIWGPESDDPDAVTATISPDGTELVVEIQPTTP